MKNIGAAIHALRIAAGLSLKEFSTLTGLSVSTISAVETGTRSLSEQALQDLRSLLGLSEDEFELISSINESTLSGSLLRLEKATKNVLIEGVIAQYRMRKHLSGRKATHPA